jgi:anti-anti-sigma factor
VLDEPPPFSAVISHARDHIVVTIDGDIDLATSPMLQHTLGVIPAAQRVVIDCTDIGFVDSSGLRVILEDYRRHVSGGGSLQVRCSPSSPMMRLLTITGIVDELSGEASH